MILMKVVQIYLKLEDVAFMYCLELSKQYNLQQQDRWKNV